MEELLKADIFFFITTIAVVLLTIFLVVALVYFILILRSFKRMLQKVEAKADEISGDIDEIRTNIRMHAERASQIASAFSAAGIARRIFSFFRDRRKSEEDSDEKE